MVVLIKIFIEIVIFIIKIDNLVIVDVLDIIIDKLIYDVKEMVIEIRDNIV